MSRPDFDALILDMDGVLLDTSGSFSVAVLESARRNASPPGLGSGWTGRDQEVLRLAGGFNNDWDAAAALALLGPATGPGPGWEALCALLEGRGGGPAAVQERVGEGVWKERRARVKEAFQLLYAGPLAADLYGLDPKESRGLWENEVPQVTAQELDSTGLPFGVLTGRSPEEARLGLSLMGLNLEPRRLVADSEPRFRKPSPDGVLELASRLRSVRPLVVGDTVDDLGAALASRARGLDAAFAGIAPEGSERKARFLRFGASRVTSSLRELLVPLRAGRLSDEEEGSP
ncbi:MAG: HAD family hydrolase [Acidobacteriota bacterium]